MRSTRIAAQVAGAAEDLHRLAGAKFQVLGGEELRLADLGDGHVAFVDHPTDLVQIGFDDVDPGRHVGDLVADHLVLDQRLAEGLAVLA